MFPFDGLFWAILLRAVTQDSDIQSFFPPWVLLGVPVGWVWNQPADKKQEGGRKREWEGEEIWYPMKLDLKLACIISVLISVALFSLPGGGEINLTVDPGKKREILWCTSTWRNDTLFNLIKIMHAYVQNKRYRMMSNKCVANTSTVCVQEEWYVPDKCN